MKYIIPILFVAVLVITSCKPNDDFITSSSAKLEFSLDTLTFDTVFTARGSATRILKVYNPHSQPILISKIMVLGAPDSKFRINVDGIPTANISDVEIAAKDSLYIFGEVTVDPDQSLSDSPFVITDELIFETNGNTQTVVLEAWGQNAHYIPNRFSADSLSLITCNNGTIRWGIDDDKPYVVFGVLFIENCVLELAAGTKIYMHGGFARIFDDEGNSTIYNDGLLYILPGGKIRSLGTVDNPVIIQGDRLEEDFEDISGQWAGLRISAGSTGNRLEHTTIKNSIVGLRADSASNVVLNSVQFYNTAGSGLVAVHANVSATNSLFHSNAGNCVQLEYGGNYDFKYCTLASYGVDASALRMTNILCLDQLCSQYRGNGLSASFKNSIIFGSRKDEISLFELEEESFVYNFEDCIVRVDELDDEGGSHTDFFDHCDPCINANSTATLFFDVDDDDYHLDSLSIAEGMADPIISIDVDLDGKERDSTTPDIGCYEYQPE